MNAATFRAARQSARQSLQAASRATGVNKAYLSEWENGLRDLSGVTMLAIERYHDQVLASGCCQACGRPLRG